MCFVHSPPARRSALMSMPPAAMTARLALPLRAQRCWLHVSQSRHRHLAREISTQSPMGPIPLCQVTPTLAAIATIRSEEHTSELQSLAYLVCRLLLEK